MVNRVPQHVADVTFRHTFRFTYNAGTAATGILPRGILGAAGVIGTVANTTVMPYAFAFKIHKVVVYISTAGQSVQLDWSGTGGAYNPGLTSSVTCVSSAQPETLIAVPPSGSNAAFWQSDSVITLFTITPSGPASGPITLDLDASYVVADSTNSPTGIAVATATVGSIYYLALDAPTTARYTPADRNTTA